MSVGRFGCRRARRAAGLVAITGGMLAAACAPPLTPTAFPEVPGVAAANAINDRGDLVGTWASGTVTRDPDRRAFVRLADGTVVDLVDPTGTWSAAEGVDINRDGVVVGNLLTPRRTGTSPGMPFFWTSTGGLVQPPPITGETALRAEAVSDDGRILVTSANGNRAWLFDIQTARYEELAGIGTQWFAADMNDRGDVVGTSWATDGATTANVVVWRGPDHEPTLLTGTGDAVVRAVAINDAGVIVADRADTSGAPSTIVAWLPGGGAPVDLGPGYARGLNEQGCVVGAGAGGARAWTVTGGAASSTELILTDANALNDNGTIAGAYDDPATDAFDNHPATSGGCPVPS